MVILEPSIKRDSYRVNAPELFSKTYPEARTRFLDGALAAGFDVSSEALPIAGPEGEELAMDFAVGGSGDADSALVVISGTHGPEGYTGSACQLGFLKSPELQAAYESHRVVLVHAHNPFGFAWMRRTTEGNVDLNRNYVDFSASLRGNPEYDRLHHAFVPADLDDAEAKQELADYREQNGPVAYMAAMLGGQRSHADGLFYGDTKATWSQEKMVSGLQKHLAQQKRVVVIDIHTGLGPYGVPYLVHGYPKTDPRFGVMADIFGEVMRSTAVQEEFDEDLPVDPEGPIVLAMDWVLPGKETFAYVIEYGTYPPDEVLGAHIADNWLHAHGDLNSDQGKAIKAELRRVMYPEFDDWKTMIWDEAVNALEKSARVLSY